MYNLFTMLFDTKRLTAVEGTNKSEYTDNLSSQYGSIQPAGNTEEIKGEKTGQAYNLFCKRIDIKISDKIIYEDDEYVVQTIKDFTYGGLPHKEAIIVLF